MAAVEYKRVIAEKEAQKTVNKLEDEIHIGLLNKIIETKIYNHILAKEKAIADASFYKAQKQAQANNDLLSP